MKLKRRRVKRGRVEIIPMIDTIVILLIFYMTFSRFASASREANIKLPGSVAGDKDRQEANQVIINMFSTDDVTIDGHSFKVADVPGLLRAIRQRDAAKSNMSVILRGDKNMTYKDLSDFMKACAKAGIIDVTFATIDSDAK
jgi:biopolymer transport protein ExbD